ATALGALDPRRHRARTTTLRELAAPEKLATAARSNHHRRAAFVTDLIRRPCDLLLAAKRTRELARLRMILARHERSKKAATWHELATAIRAFLSFEHRQVMRCSYQALNVRVLDLLRERAVERAEHLAPVDGAVLHLVEVALHVRRELDVEYVRQALHHHALDLFSQVGRKEAALLQQHVTPVRQRRDDRCVSRRTSNAQPLQLLYKTRFREAGRWLGEMLRGLDTLDRDLLALGHSGQRLLVFQRLAVTRFTRFLIERLVARELHDASRRAEHIPSEIEIHRRRVEHGGRHLRSHEALPYQLVELELVILQVTLDSVGTTCRIGRPHGFVGILGVLALAITVELRAAVREKLLAEQRPQIIARGGRCGIRDARRIGTHVRNESHGAFGTDLHTLVQILRKPHRALGPESESLGCFLLQCACRERRVRVLATLAPLDLGYRESLESADIVENALRVGGVGYLRLLSVDMMQLRREFLTGLLEQCRDRPVLDRLERAYLTLTLDYESQSDRLHSACRRALFDRLPQHRARLVANPPVEHAARQLRLDETLIDVSGVVDRRTHRLPRYLVEQDTPNRRAALALDLRRNVPCDSLAFAVRIGGEKDLTRFLRGGLEFRERLLLAGNRDVFRLEAVVDVDAHLLLGQVTDVTDSRAHLVTAPEILANGLGLGG